LYFFILLITWPNNMYDNLTSRKSSTHLIFSLCSIGFKRTLDVFKLITNRYIIYEKLVKNMSKYIILIECTICINIILIYASYTSCVMICYTFKIYYVATKNNIVRWYSCYLSTNLNVVFIQIMYCRQIHIGTTKQFSNQRLNI